MDAKSLSEAMGCSLARAAEMLPGMEGAMRAAIINTPLRAALTDGNVRCIGKNSGVNTGNMITNSGLTRLPFYDTNGNWTG